MDRSRSGERLHPRQLSGRITYTANVQALLQLHCEHGASYNHIHAANTWNKLGKVQGVSEPRHAAEVGKLLSTTQDGRAIDEQIQAGRTRRAAPQQDYSSRTMLWVSYHKHKLVLLQQLRPLEEV